MPTKLSYSLLDVLGCLLDLERTHTLEDCLEICHEGCGRNDNHLLVHESVLDQIFSIRFNRAHLIDQQVVIDSFTGNKHEGEIHGPLTGTYVLGCLIDPVLEILLKKFLQPFAFSLIVSRNNTIVILK